MTIISWLDAPQVPGGTTTNLQRLAELVAVNGGFRVRGYGMIQIGGPYGRYGLTDDEAHELLHMSGIFRGLTLAHPELEPEAIQRIKHEISIKESQGEINP